MLHIIIQQHPSIINAIIDYLYKPPSNLQQIIDAIHRIEFLQREVDYFHKKYIFRTRTEYSFKLNVELLRIGTNIDSILDQFECKSIDHLVKLKYDAIASKQQYITLKCFSHSSHIKFKGSSTTIGIPSKRILPHFTT